ncbi:MAG: hypothetical protein A3I88_02105 [Candidatus Portnoybacteria bacterium RIFCSPLOWO2_12_FULL_39_9]|uniref:Type II toxin-antitoxin system mRNA interferase toxin, RelE/StbE family n=1 Tax=Candidatus Portnoybacteria bacterium RIFCSPHIGHO2_12_FULL_38_9 TaxID=1801997 RepID=A0A1G2FFW0_9BACT|nr:MAG: hypothetical protein A3H00_01015 [Candidatus Portnoybacteria bacterium RBG_13_40_8]OGZ36162.1 MAG: hypothetical protein A2646_01035 [Candidatus Portnoybacteria bacterium RIFCSPHIGHO2_02_FULL_39_12]OGZ36520.1 MAG: hypothetical protein A3J64_02760 [Candidatus Portnoybacteria bacterium RIFCSPHIGHO2_12_FULL_38_9]OGZ38529.1 MAG: hypothetical protein A3F21_02270 [Candidatus Portnoybacteria bacterium RIFCSPLOWO2_01_FULL_38_39]OGZ41292.1 MAG: hypothetical protein A3I88_02105 [Candidatus Portnoy
MIIRKTKDFSKEFKKLPLHIKRLFQKQEVIFVKNWLDSRLHTKRIKELPGSYSFRITRRYRVLFYFRNKEVIFFSIGHRKDIYR